MKSSLVLLTFFLIFFFCKRNDLVEADQEKLLPPKVYKELNQFNNFQMGTWSNILVDNTQKAEILCQELQSIRKHFFSKILCHSQIKEFNSEVIELLKNQFFLRPAPSVKEFSLQANKELTKISLLMGEDSEQIMNLLRMDPSNQKETLFSHFNHRTNSSFEWDGNFYVHKEFGKALIPVKFNYPPENIYKTQELSSLLEKNEAVMFGAHQSHLDNRSIIEDDLTRVGIVGGIITVLLLLLTIYTKRIKLLKLLIPNALGVCAAIFFTWLFFGKVHAITLSFGSGILGLAIDYGIHSLFTANKKEVWHSNFYGLITTLSVFFVFAFSSIPLVREMMIFSAIGLSVAFLATYLLIQYDHIDIDIVIIAPKKRWMQAPLIISVIGLMFLSTFKIDSSITRFNYTPPRALEKQDWFFNQLKSEPMHYKIYNLGDLEVAREDVKRSEEKQIKSENMFWFYPPNKIQEEYVSSWRKFSNEIEVAKLDGVVTKVYSPFFDNLYRLNQGSRLNLNPAPSYLSHLVNGKKVMNLWFVKNAQEKEELQKSIADVHNLTDLFSKFSADTSFEIILFLIITLGIIWFQLFIKYRDLSRTIICLVPFLFVIGLYGFLFHFFRFPISFMTMLGLLLIYGISVDYGLFAVDYFSLHRKGIQEESKLNLTFILSWSVNFLGFLPYIWCRHPILHDLGLVIIVGMLGILYATMFVVPVFCLRDTKQ
jgi:predicted RND superfamily exporter protein